MATTLLAKVYAPIKIVSSRLTCLGFQFTVETPKFVDVVTVDGESITCTCGSSTCEHIAEVKRELARFAVADENRARYEAAFDLSYGDFEYCYAG